MKNKHMDLNRETAMRLWNKTFGKETKGIDFAFRVIAKGAYGDRNSEFGWNVDHILPESHGGKTNDSNLIITHIKTNDEKADKFPCFTANETKFEIIKVQNHYEIRKVDNVNIKKAPEIGDEVNFLDSAAGVRFFKKLKGIQNKPRFVGTVLIRLKNLKNTAVVDFIERFLDEENISYQMEKNYSSSETTIVAKNYNMPKEDDVNNLLDKCILLNTYLSYYFTDSGYIDAYDIRYRLDCYKEKESMYVEDQKKNLMNASDNGYWYPLFNISGGYENTLLINNLVVINSDAGLKVDTSSSNGWVTYNYVYTKLAKQLEKEVSRQ